MATIRRNKGGGHPQPRGGCLGRRAPSAKWPRPTLAGWVAHAGAEWRSPAPRPSWCRGRRGRAIARQVRAATRVENDAPYYVVVGSMATTSGRGRRNVTRVIAWWCDECRRCSNIVYCFLSIDFHAQIASQTSIVGTPHRGAAGSAQGNRVHGPISARSKPHLWGASRTGSRTRIEGCPCPEKVCRI